VKRRINNQLDEDKLRFIDVISSTCFGHHYAHHQEYRSETTDLFCTPDDGHNDARNILS
jgi:uncharacterized protein (DUF1919 family)